MEPLALCFVCEHSVSRVFLCHRLNSPIRGVTQLHLRIFCEGVTEGSRPDFWGWELSGADDRRFSHMPEYVFFFFSRVKAQIPREGGIISKESID